MPLVWFDDERTIDEDSQDISDGDRHGAGRSWLSQAPSRRCTERAGRSSRQLAVDRLCRLRIGGKGGAAVKKRLPLLYSPSVTCPATGTKASFCWPRFSAQRPRRQLMRWVGCSVVCEERHPDLPEPPEVNGTKPDQLKFTPVAKDKITVSGHADLDRAKVIVKDPRR